jgi:hypothetical protein
MFARSSRKATLGKLNWPETPFNEVLETAFKGRVIDSEDHPIVRRLRGLE